MASPLLSTQIGKALKEFLTSISDKNLTGFIQSVETQPGQTNSSIDFGSKDFLLVYTGYSDGEPPGRHMFEIRPNKKSEIPGLRKVATSSQKYAQNQRRLALILVDGEVARWIEGPELRDAFLASPQWEAGVINKVHVRWTSKVLWSITGDGQPRLPHYPVNGPRFEFEKIPFEGYNEDGTKINVKQVKQQKQGEASGSKK